MEKFNHTRSLSTFLLLLPSRPSFSFSFFYSYYYYIVMDLVSLETPLPGIVVTALVILGLWGVTLLAKIGLHTSCQSRRRRQNACCCCCRWRWKITRTSDNPEAPPPKLANQTSTYELQERGDGGGADQDDEAEEASNIILDEEDEDDERPVAVAEKDDTLAEFLSESDVFPPRRNAPTMQPRAVASDDDDDTIVIDV